MSTPGLLDALAHSIETSAPPPVAQNTTITVFNLLIVDSFRPIIGSKKPLVCAIISIVSAREAAARTLKDVLNALFWRRTLSLESNVNDRAGIGARAVLPSDEGWPDRCCVRCCGYDLAFDWVLLEGVGILMAARFTRPCGRSMESKAILKGMILDST